MVTKAQLRRLFPKARAELVDVVVDHWSEAEAIGITTRKRISGFFAQIGTETGELTSVSESMNYSVAGLRATFGKHRISDADVQRLGRKKGERQLSEARQKQIADIVYGGAFGKKNLGNTEPGDGWLYRGGGMMQTTGRAGYRAMGFEDNPDALRDPLTAFRTALREWKKRGCNARSDRGDETGNRKAINGGTNGLDHCLAIHRRALLIFPEGGARMGLLADPVVVGDDPIPVKLAGPEEDPVPVAVVDAEPVGEVYTDAHRVALAQQWFRNLGYTEIGEPNGVIGPFTRDTIRNYRARKGLPPGEHLDFQIMGTLATDTEPRELPAARVNASAAEVRAKVPEVKANFLAKVWSGITGIGAAAVAFGSGVIENISSAKGYIEPVKDLLGDIPPWAWAMAVVGIAFVIYRSAAAGEKAGIEAVQTGARR